MQKLDLVAIGHLIKETIKFPHKTIGPVLGSPVAYSSVAAARLGVVVIHQQQQRLSMTVVDENALSRLRLMGMWDILPPIIPRKHFRINLPPYRSVVNGVFNLCEKPLGTDT